MLPTIAAGRRLSLRAIVWQLLAIAAVSLAFLAKGGAWALAAATGGLAVVLGNWLFSRLVLGSGADASTVVLMRLLAGMVLKWVVVIVALVAAVGAGLPPLAMLTGVVIALVVQMLAMAGIRQTRSGTS